MMSKLKLFLLFAGILILLMLVIAAKMEHMSLSYILFITLVALMFVVLFKKKHRRNARFTTHLVSKRFSKGPKNDKD